MKIFKKGNLSEAEIVQWLKDMRVNAWVPESGFAVAAVFRAGAGGADDYYFAGVNVENPEHRISTHGEEGCIAAMVVGLGPQAEIVEGWVMGARQDAPPESGSFATCCGKCRQQIAGFAGANVKIHSVALSGRISTTTVGAFLPEAFSSRAYITDSDTVKSAAAPSEEEVRNRLMRPGNLAENEIFTWLKKTESINFVSKTPQAIVLQLDNGASVAGAKIEEAAFNGMNAAQSALAIAASEFGRCKITGAWVYPKKGLTLSALQALSPVVENHEIPVRFFDESGNVQGKTLAEAACINRK